MTGAYIPGNWYWIVGADQARVYSSAKAGYVPLTDAGYLAWLDAGQRATRIDTEASLADVLRLIAPAGVGALGPIYVPLSLIRTRVTAAGKWPAFAAALDGLAADKKWHLLSLTEGVASNDPDALALLQAIGLDPAAILAP